MAFTSGHQMYSIDFNPRQARVFAIFLVALFLVVSLSTSGFAQPSQHKRDSSARADSSRHAKQGMQRMKMPMKKRVAKKTAKSPAAKSKRPTAKAAAKPMTKMQKGMQMGEKKSAETGGAGAMHAMPAPKDTTPMRGMPSMKPAPSAPPGGGMAMTGMKSGAAPAIGDTMSTSMMVPDPLGISMERMGSGTTWIPDAVSLPSRHYMKGEWDLMLHGFVFAQYDHQNGPRGADQIGSLNWGMFMASHELAGGRFQARTMLSLDAATVTARGYPLLLQSGESYRGKPLHDRQHPHDFWMELAAMYERPITDNIGVLLYAAPSGEPALGPVAFMHRPSAMDNPTAPLAHHWQDATHVSFGVLTAGLFTHDWKLEGSIFNGREPDEHRWNFDPIRLDSYSGRLSFNPKRTWALSAGYGYMKSMEALHPEERTHRVTASAMHGAPIRDQGQWASTLVWGANTHSSNPGLSHSVTVETEAILDQWNTVIARGEYVQKTAEDLALDEPPSNFPSTREFNVGTMSLGYIRELTRYSGTTIGIGAMATLNFVPAAIETEYGSRTLIGTLIFLRLRPFHLHPMQMKQMPGESMIDGGGTER